MADLLGSLAAHSEHNRLCMKPIASHYCIALLLQEQAHCWCLREGRGFRAWRWKATQLPRNFCVFFPLIHLPKNHPSLQKLRSLVLCLPCPIWFLLGGPHCRLRSWLWMASCSWFGSLLLAQLPVHDVLLTRKGRLLYRRPGDHWSAFYQFTRMAHSLHSLDVQSTKIWKMEIYSDYFSLSTSR